MLKASAKKLIKKEPKAPAPQIVEEKASAPEFSNLTLNCECGKEAFPGSHQCWECSHRA